MIFALTGAILMAFAIGVLAGAMYSGGSFMKTMGLIVLVIGLSFWLVSMVYDNPR